MKRFLLQILFFLTLIGLGFLGVLLQVDGYDDDFYYRFSSPQQKGLILGTSRAAQGLMPSVIEKTVGKPIFNFSFTRSFSPYSQLYTQRILEKIAPDTRRGLFLLAIDCWSIASDERMKESKPARSEEKTLLGDIGDVNLDPNIPYLLDRFAGRYYEILLDDTSTFLHKDGWLEVNVEMDSASIAMRTRTKLLHYQGLKERLSISSAYATELSELVIKLKQMGEVYLVRLPVDPEMRRIEEAFESQFQKAIAPAVLVSNGYLDLNSHDQYMRYTDGNHLHSSSAIEVSQMVSDWILKKRMN